MIAIRYYTNSLSINNRSLPAKGLRGGTEVALEKF